MDFFIVYVAAIIAAQIVTMLHMLYWRRNHSTVLAWSMAIVMFPFPAFILYFIFGNRKIRQKCKKKGPNLYQDTIIEAEKLNPIETVLASHTISKTTCSNAIRLCFDGVEAYHMLMDAIADARESIYISTYIFEDDSTTRMILDALTRKASEGVDVRLLLDGVGSYRLYFHQHPLRSLRDAGGEAIFFMPIWNHPLRNYINLRNHRKIYLFDNRIAFAGGMNLEERYLGSKPMKKRWVDMIFRLEGEAVTSYREIFNADYDNATGKSVCMTHSTMDHPGNHRIQVVPSGPDMSSDALYEALLNAIHTAQKRVWIVTPYFVPDETVLRALIIAKHKGTDVKLITPKVSNHWIADIARSSYMREAEENGIDVLLYQGNMLHTKAVVFDDYAVMLGSVNIDNRSLFLNYEVASFVYSTQIIEQTEQWIQSLIVRSVSGMKKGSRPRIVLENFMRIFSPQL